MDVRERTIILHAARSPTVVHQYRENNMYVLLFKLEVSELDPRCLLFVSSLTVYQLLIHS